MKLLFSLFLSILFLGFGDAIGQNLIIKNDTIPFGTDSTATLILPQYRGQMLWQVSYDKQNWITFENEKLDTLTIDFDKDSWYRSMVVDGTCDTVYTDTVKVIISDSLRNYYQSIVMPVAYPNELGEIIDVFFNNDTITCKKINDEYVFQDDMIFTERQIKVLTENKGASIPTDEMFLRLWPNATVCYSIDPLLTNDSRIDDAISYWENKTNIKFKLRENNETDYVEFTLTESGCRSQVGMTGGPQRIWISNEKGYYDFTLWKTYKWKTFDLCHEIGHTIGLFHEQSRKDRDKYIKVHEERINKELLHNYAKHNNSVTFGEFDFKSLMLYPPCSTESSIGSNDVLMTVLDPITGIDTGRPWKPEYRKNEELSSMDIDFIKWLYAFRPFVNTAGVSIFNGNIAVCKGNVINDGGSEVTEHGIYWDTKGDPSINTNNANKIIIGSGLGRFVAYINDLQPNTNYYVRAYAKNRKGESYGNIENFSTIGLGSPPTIITLPMSVGYYASKTGSLDSVITYNYGEVVDEGGFSVEKRGICWNLDGDPNTADDYLYDPFTGKGKSKLTLKIGVNISYDKNYYLRAFGKNLKGTSYGNVITFIIPNITSLLPEIATNEIAGFTQTTADVGGNLSGDRKIDIISRGICWNTVGNPNIHDNQIIIGNESDNFSTKIQELIPNTTYYVRAFARLRYNGADYYYEYGTERKFTTLIQSKPTVSTSKVNIITQTSATSGGNITNDGGAPIILRGVCWSTSEWPTLSNSNDKTLDGGGAGIFLSNLANLTPNTEYHVRAYATNNFDTAYGDQETFTTSATKPLVATMYASNLTQNSVVLNGTVSSDGGSPISQHGFYWCQGDREPTINDSVNIAIGTTDSFSKQIKGLQPNTLYSFKAFATNNFGTAFGSVLLFATDAAQQISSPTFTAPANYAIFNRNNTSSLTIQWSGVSGANEYWLNVFPSGQAAYPVFNDSVGNVTTKALAINILENGIYVIQVRARASGGEWSIYSQAREFILDTPPLNPILASPAKEAAITRNTQQTFSWAAPSGNIARYYLRIVSGTNLNLDPVYAEEFSATSNNVNCSWPAGTYSWSVRALKVTPEGYSPAIYETTIGWGSYAPTQSFTIKDPLTLPAVTTNSITDITQTTAVSGGYITSDGGAEITARGVCWSTTPNPTINNSNTTEGSGTGSFTSNLTGLTANTTYYLRAYARNIQGDGYGNELIFNTKANNSEIIFNPNLTYGTVTDIDGNVYKTIQIGTQTWMAENLKTTNFNDGTSIPNITDNTEWANLTTSGYCWYNNDVSYKNPNGALYNWYVVNTGKLAPVGWHVPNVAEWKTLSTFLGGENVAGGKLKEIGTTKWYSPNTGATNETGFSAIPSGPRSPEGTYYDNRNSCIYWSSSEYNIYFGWYQSMVFDRSNTSITQNFKRFGLSIRCVKDDYIASFEVLTITTNSITSITQNSSTSGGNITSDGGAVVTAHGVCWSNSENPTTANSKTIDGSGTGSFTTSLTALTANTTYFVRAYATNIAGTGYGNQETFTTSPLEPGTVADIDGNIYHTVTIGTQVWMSENLRTSRYRNGNPLAVGEWCNYNNDEINGTKYGKLYKWSAVADTRNVAPEGWHVATDAEWTTLENFINVGDINLDETSGFKALTGGYLIWDGTFVDIGVRAYWWNPIANGNSYTWSGIYWYPYSSNLDRFTNENDYSFSVRCIKDN